MYSVLKLFLMFSIFTFGSIDSYKEGDPYKTLLQMDFGQSPSSPKRNGKCGEPVYLTKYLNQKKADEGRRAAQVNCTLLKCKKSYAGYITVNETYNTNLWFLYIPATGKPTEKAPVLVYPSVAPGIYSTYDYFTIIAPRIITSEGNLKKNNATWTRRHSVIMIDAPAGSGFSFTDDDRGYAVNASQVGQQLFTFMKQILLIFVELQTAKIYLVGNSYGSVITSSIAMKILENGRNRSPFDVQGIITFDGFNDPRVKFNSSQTNLVLGLIDKQTAKRIADLETAGAKAVGANDISTAIKFYNQSTTLLTKNRPLANPWSIVLDTSIPSSVYLQFLNSSEVRSCLHVGDQPLQVLGKAYDKLQKDIFSGYRRTWWTNLINNYAVLVISETLATFAPYYPEELYYRSLNFKNVDEYRNASRKTLPFNGTTVGYYKEAKNITLLNYRNMGNFLGVEHPEQVEEVLYTFTNYKRVGTA